MGHTKHIHLLLASVLVTSVAFAQTTDTQTPDSAPAEGAVVAARSQYTPTGLSRLMLAMAKRWLSSPSEGWGLPFRGSTDIQGEVIKPHGCIMPAPATF
jgi:hypothetical protein